MDTKHNRVTFVTVLKRLAGYLSGDSLNYLLGFLIYAWLVRSLTNREYGYLSVATVIYQAFLVVVALGLDLIGPRMLAESSEDLSVVVRRVQSLRFKFAVLVCLPLVVLIGLGYLRAHQPQVTIILVAGFAMILARVFDVSYVAVALARPKPLVYSRALGLTFYLLTLFALRGVIARHVWTIPVLNAAGVMGGRALLLRWLGLRAFGSGKSTSQGSALISWRLLLSGARTGLGQLVLFSTQSLDVALLNRYLDPGAVGQYAMMSRLYLFGTAVLGCVLNAFIPELVLSIARNDFWHRHRRFMATSGCVGVLGAVTFYFLGSRLTEALGGRSLPLLHAIAPIFGLLFLLMSLANPFISFLPSLQLETEYLGGVVLGGCATFLSDLLLIPRLGVVGAAWGQVIGISVLGLYSMCVVTRYMARRNVCSLAEVRAAAGD